jgi:tetratricopeptide (TPR) repeat protein
MRIDDALERNTALSAFELRGSVYDPRYHDSLETRTVLLRFEMSRELKNYIAIGIGVAVVTSFAIQSFSPEMKTAVTFQTEAEDFKSISSFENSRPLLNPPLTASPLAELKKTTQTSSKQPSALEKAKTARATAEAKPKRPTTTKVPRETFSSLPNVTAIPAATTPPLVETTQPLKSTIKNVAGIEPVVQATLKKQVQKATEANTQPSRQNKTAFNKYGTNQRQTIVRQASNEVSAPAPRTAAPIRLPLPEQIAHQAVHHIEYGKALSRRGSFFSAQQEFYAALRIIAISNDSQTSTNHYSQALAEAAVAMKEAQDFVRTELESEAFLSVASTVETHQSKIINQAELDQTSPRQAVQQYFQFAQNRLDQAGGRNVVSAEAFCCLGKLHTSMKQSEASPRGMDVAKAIAFHRAALLSDPNNSRSANELGVLMAKIGQLDSAVTLFQQSLMKNQTPQTWKNLAKTHQQKGEFELAKAAEDQYLALMQAPLGNNQSSIRWVDQGWFNQNQTNQFSQVNPTRNATDRNNKNQPAAVSADQRDSIPGKTLTDRIKEFF